MLLNSFITQKKNYVNWLSLSVDIFICIILSKDKKFRIPLKCLVDFLRRNTVSVTADQ